mmetsp:Transcript_27417/g.89397  ORF Transcript_27417/g.89397 Transcript_27417/m.89397 type:complete len:135 (+) Transcript_27417:117-521(+)
MLQPACARMASFRLAAAPAMEGDMRAVLQLRRCCLSEGVVEGLLASRPNVSARTEESMRLVYMSISYQLLGVLAHRVQQIAWTGNWSMEERLEDFEENYEHDAKTRWTRATSQFPWTAIEHLDDGDGARQDLEL